MKLNNSIWKSKVDQIDDLLSERPTPAEKEAFLKAKVDHFVGVQIKDYTSYNSEVTDHLISALAEDSGLESKADFLKAYYKVLIDDFGGAKGLQKQAYKKFHLESKSLTQGFYKWSIKLTALHIIVITAIVTIISFNNNHNTILYTVYPFCFIVGIAVSFFSIRYFKKTKSQEVFKTVPVYKYEASNIVFPVTLLIPFAASVIQSKGSDPLFYSMTILTWFGTYYVILYFFFLKEKIEESSNKLSTT